MTNSIDLPQNTSLDAPLITVLGNALRADERPVFVAQPDADLLARHDPRLVVTGVFWVIVAGAGFWGFGATLLGTEYDGLPLAVRAAVVLIAVAPFAVVGWFALHGHVGLRRRAALRSAFVVTNQRVLSIAPRLRIAGPLHADGIELGAARWAPGSDADGACAEIVDERGVAAPIVVTGLADAAELRGAIEVAQRAEPGAGGDSG